MNKSIEAYNNDERVRRYDADMDLMHPNRHKMIDVVLEVLPFGADDRLRILDLGIGTGFVAAHLLERYPAAAVIGIDGSRAMLRLAATRLGGASDRVRLVEARFEDFGGHDLGELDLVVSSYALHHLDAKAKRRLLCDVTARMRAGGWLLNADLVSSPHRDIEAIIQTIRARGIVSRNAGADRRFGDLASVRSFLDGLEAGEGDQPLRVEEDLALLRACGIDNATVFWQEYREVVYGGSK